MIIHDAHWPSLVPSSLLGIPREEKKRAWHTMTAHALDLYPLAQDSLANGCTQSSMELELQKQI